MSERPRVTVIVNPERATILDDLLSGLHDCDVDVVEPDSFDDLPETVDAAVAAGADVIGAVGGDGTQRTVAARLAGTGVAHGVIPGGTVNLLAKTLGIDDFATAADAIARGDRTTFDIGCHGDERFLLAATTGYDATVVSTVPEGPRRRFGLIAYLSTGIARLRTERPHRVDVVVDGTTVHTGPAMSVLVMNVVQRGSAAFELAPGGSPHDGRLEVVVQRCSGWWATARTMFTLALGRRPAPRDQVQFGGRHVELRWERPVRLQIDGDAAGEGSEFDFDLDVGALVICRPNGDRAGR